MCCTVSSSFKDIKVWDRTSWYAGLVQGLVEAMKTSGFGGDPTAVLTYLLENSRLKHKTMIGAQRAKHNPPIPMAKNQNVT